MYVVFAGYSANAVFGTLIRLHDGIPPTPATYTNLALCIAQAVVAFLFNLLAFIGLGIGLARVQNDEAAQASARHCQSAYNQSLVSALHARSVPTRHAVLAPHQFFQTLYPQLKAALNGQQQLSPHKRHQVLEDLTAANAHANSAYHHYRSTIKQNPLPMLPNDVCGDQTGDGK